MADKLRLIPNSPPEVPKPSLAKTWAEKNDDIKIKPDCVYCGEPVRPGDPRAPMQQDAHHECGLRSVVGGLNHLTGACSCCGGDQEPDPPGLSRREAAIVAAALWRHRNSVQARGPR